jgi:hypothetical protein
MGFPNNRICNLKGENGGTYCATINKAYAPGAPCQYWDTLVCNVAGVFNLVAGNIGGDAMSAVNLSAGQVIHGKFTSVTPSSGSLFAYNGDKPSAA